MNIQSQTIEVISLSDLAIHNGLDLETMKLQIGFNGNMCHLYELNSYFDEDLDADGHDDDVLVNLWS